MAQSKVFAVIKYLLFLGVGITLLVLAFKDVNLTQMLEDFKQSKWWWAVVSIVLGYIAFIFRAQRWVILLEPFGYQPKLSNSLHSVNSGYIANLAVPRLGEVTRCTALNQVEKIPVHTLIGTVILERVIDLIMLMLLMFSVILIKFDLFGSFFTELIREKLSNFNISIGTLVIVALSAVTSLILLYVFRNTLGQFAFLDKIRTFIRGVFDGFAAIFKLKKKGWFIFHTLMIWLTYYLMTYVCFFCLEETQDLGMVAGLFILVVGGIGMSAPVQGGIGVYHLLVEAGLKIFGIEPHETDTGVVVSPGLLFATIVHTSQTLLVLFSGSISILLLYFERQKILKSETSRQINQPAETE